MKLLTDLRQCLLPLHFKHETYWNIRGRNWAPYATLGDTDIYCIFIHDEVNHIPNEKWIRRSKRMDFDKSKMIVLVERCYFHRFDYPIMLDCRGDKNIIYIKNQQ